MKGVSPADCKKYKLANWKMLYGDKTYAVGLLAEFTS